jgi:hypothetical protein
MTTLERFESKICRTELCWNWLLTVNNYGYGKFVTGPDWPLRRKQVLAHRLSYQLNVGPIPEGLQLDHLCRNKLCVNPTHLEPVTTRVNTLRSFGPSSVNAKKTHCYKGHELCEDNIYRFGNKRLCRICRAAAEQRRRDKLKALYGVTCLQIARRRGVIPVEPAVSH